MIEIRFQGRGGQGVVIASQLLGRACFQEGLYAQCYSLFGGERRGAPVAAFVRVSDRKIFLKCDIERPNHLVLLDRFLLTEKEISEKTARSGTILFNTGEMIPSDLLRSYKIGQIDALRISRRNGLGPIVNTAVLGAYVGLTQVVKLETLLNIVAEYIPSEVEKNINASKEAYEEVSVFHSPEAD